MRPLPIFPLTLTMLFWSSSFIALKHVLGVCGFGQALFMRTNMAAGCWGSRWDSCRPGAPGCRPPPQDRDGRKLTTVRAGSSEERDHE